MKRHRSGSLLSGGLSGSLGPARAKNSKLTTDKESSGGRLSSETEASLSEMMSLFPVEVFEKQLPAIVLKHQLYSVIPDRTQVDRELLSLRDSGKVRIFKLGVADDEYALVWTEDYKHHVGTVLGSSSQLYKKFVEVVLPGNQEVSISKAQLSREMKLSEEEITMLVNRGVLLVRDVGRACSWWFAIPRVSLFTKSFTRGRGMVLQMIKRKKYHEILQTELEGRKMTVSKLSMLYHIHDIIGADLVESIPTTSGPLLRLVEDSKTKS